MSTTISTPEKKFRSYVPDNTTMPEFTLRAVLLGLVLTVILGAANAYLGLRAGMTIAATYPAAVIGMAVLRLMKGSILEENIARTVGSIGESVAAGAIFTIPAFVISGAWPVFDFEHAYWKSSILMLVGGVLGILFVTLLRRVMVEDPELPFPESVAASQIHIAGQQGSRAAKILFGNMGFGGLVYLLGQFSLFSASRDFIVNVGNIGHQLCAHGPQRYRAQAARRCGDHGVRTRHQPGLSRRRLHHRPAPGFAELRRRRHRLGPAGSADPVPRRPNPGRSVRACGHHVSRHCILGRTGRGGMELHRAPDRRRRHAGGRVLTRCSACARAWASGMARAVSDLKKSAAAHAGTARTERDLNAKFVFGGLLRRADQHDLSVQELRRLRGGPASSRRS